MSYSLPFFLCEKAYVFFITEYKIAVLFLCLPHENIGNMPRKTFQFDYDVCDLKDLSSTERELIETAKKACETSYAPYSHFHVGAAALLDDGTIFMGSNQENASFTVGTCAERCTIYAAHAHYPASRIRALAIAAKNSDGKFLKLPITPCGACRQALLETEQHQSRPASTSFRQRSSRLNEAGPLQRLTTRPDQFYLPDRKSGICFISRMI